MPRATLIPGLLSLTLLLGSSGCALLERDASAQSKDDSAKPAPPAPKPDPMPRAPEMAITQAILPKIGADAPTFPLLPGEDPERSRSVGDVSFGFLYNATHVVLPEPHMGILDVQSRRGLNYTSNEVALILRRAAEHVAKQHPGAITYLGNLSKPGGGDIPYSVSHNSGRDADLAFFVRDEYGQPAVMPELLPLDEEGVYAGEQGYYVFDVPRSWSLVEGLILSAGDSIQYLFVANWLRDRMLAHAAEIDADPALVARARVVMQQPRASLPHNDHFHLRIFCSPDDRASGCVNSGRSRPWLDDHNAARRGAIESAESLLDDEDPGVRLVAVRRLAVMGARPSAKRIAERLADEDPLVRAAAVRALADFGTRSRELAKLLASEEHPEVVGEAIAGLGELGGVPAARALVAKLDEPKPLEFISGPVIDVRILAIDVLATMEEEYPVKRLIALLDDEDPAVRARAAVALRMTTNHRFMAEDTEWDVAGEDARREATSAWKSWYKEYKKAPREEWLAMGFQARGFDVTRSMGAKEVWALCRAISDLDHVSYNAQRALMRLAKREPASLSWSKADASFYWRRWFERRYRRFGAPPIPRDLSTMTAKKQ